LCFLGFGYHGDFISGWDENLLQAAVEQCTNNSGMLSDCPLFTLISEDEQRKCKIPTPPMIASEKLAGIIGDVLPGGVEIQYGPAPAVHKGSQIALPSISLPAPNVLPGGVFQEKPTSTPEVQAVPEPTPEVQEVPEPTSSPTPTPSPIPSDPPVPEGYELVRTDYVTNGNVVSKIVVIETVEYVMMATETVTVTATPGVEKARREVQHLHLHRRHQHGHGHGAH
jgi:hypothetical protein